MDYPWVGSEPFYYLPMLNFGTVESGLYRSGFPLERNRPFLKQLGIRTILYAFSALLTNWVGTWNPIKRNLATHWSYRSIVKKTECNWFMHHST